MKIVLLPLCLLVFFVSASSQNNYWQQELRYNINVSLDDQVHRLKGDIAITYINHSPDTLNYIWFHLWPNAYRNTGTALSRQISTSGSKKQIQDTGYIDDLAFRVNNQPANTAPDSANNIDVTKVILNTPLLPGDSVRITTPFMVQLPSYYSRSGHDGQQYMICQWYPKPAVYDRKGWHPMPYLDQGEFYSEFGSFTVNITLPNDYVVGATGELLTASELEAYRRIGTVNVKEGKKKLAYTPVSKDAMKTLRYHGDNIHDFAWFADKDFVIEYDTLNLSGPKPVDVFSYHQPNGNKQWNGSVNFIKDAVRKYSSWIGEYPYPVVAAVEGPKNLTSGGMEYPMITLITSPEADKENLDAVITHEVGHNWFYGILGTNERDHPWMDEGINTWFQFRYEAEKYRANSVFGGSVPKQLKSLTSDQFLSRIYTGLNTIPATEPIETQSAAFSNKDEYGIVVYIKTAIWMAIMESSIGKDDLDKGIKEYFNDWKFKHPYPEDFRQSLEKASGRKMDEIFVLLQKRGNF